jgi:hypothetical protein
MLRQSQVNKIKRAEADLGRALREFAMGSGAMSKITRARAVLGAALRNASHEEIAVANQRPA